MEPCQFNTQKNPAGLGGHRDVTKGAIDSEPSFIVKEFSSPCVLHTEIFLKNLFQERDNLFDNKSVKSN